ncbi:tetratricopeptide repeat protein [Bacillus sp. FJAT-47783]|uniref:tetratricopeptide repeat protein n=1 Tax=Bacillus sp. FJAT-47783 TaxID=2922712 RepID=UPI001FAC1314|nr:tetratricopeptide repeat protein [Bacillus sp. FJAT-47783]
MTKLPINPLLIHALTGKELDDLPQFPTHSLLPSEFLPLVLKKINHIHTPLINNEQKLICTECEKTGTYDIGLVLYNLQKAKKNANLNPLSYTQTTGYFRCIHCNSASNWKETTDLMLFLTTGLIQIQAGVEDDRFGLGVMVLYDGTQHQFVTDAEKYLLEKVLKKENGHIWSRLGNLYYKGNRPDLAIVAFERSLKLDPMQTESLFNIGKILMDIGELELAASYLRKAVASSSVYKYMKGPDLRDILTDALSRLLELHLGSDKKIPFLPEASDYEMITVSGENKDHPKNLTIDMDISLDHPDSLVRLAEIMMGKKRSEIPIKERTYTPNTFQNKRRKLEQKRKRKKKKK